MTGEEHRLLEKAPKSFRATLDFFQSATLPRNPSIPLLCSFIFFYFFFTFFFFFFVSLFYLCICNACLFVVLALVNREEGCCSLLRFFRLPGFFFPDLYPTFFLLLCLVCLSIFFSPHLPTIHICLATHESSPPCFNSGVVARVPLQSAKLAVPLETFPHFSCLPSLTGFPPELRHSQLLWRPLPCFCATITHFFLRFQPVRSLSA